MSACVLLILVNELRKRDKMQGYAKTSVNLTTLFPGQA